MCSTAKVLATFGAVGAMAATAHALPVDGTITDIHAELHGDWSLESPSSFIPKDSQDAHFDLDTLVVSEHVPGYVDDTGGMPGQLGPDGRRPASRWADLWVSVTREFSDQPAMIAIDKQALNWTNHLWTDFHMEVGILPLANSAGTDGGMFPLYPIEGLDFKSEPAPIEENDKFGPAMFMDGPMGVPSLWWFAGSNGGVDRLLEYPGVEPQESANFWLGLNVPDSLFNPIRNPLGERSDTHEIAYFTLRQHWTPTPGAAGTMALAFGVMGVRRRRTT